MEPPPEPDTFGSLLRRYRLRAGITQELLATRAGVAEQYRRRARMRRLVNIVVVLVHALSFRGRGFVNGTDRRGIKPRRD